MKYLFVRSKFQWREHQFSIWTIADGCVIVAGLLVVMPIFGKLFKFSDTFSGGVGAFARGISKLSIGLAPESKFLFIGKSKVVHTDEVDFAEVFNFDLF